MSASSGMNFAIGDSAFCVARAARICVTARVSSKSCVVMPMVIMNGDV